MNGADASVQVVGSRVSGRQAWLAALLVAGAAATQGGCLSRSYEIHKPELARLSAVPPVLRGMKVDVEQELTTSDVEPAPHVNERTVTVSAGFGVNVGGGGHGGGYGARPRPRPGTGGGGFGGMNRGNGSAASDARATAITILVLATFGLVIAGTIEGQRYEGTVQLHPMHPVHLFGRDGGYLVMPLAEIDPATVQWTERAVIRGSEGPMRFLERAPLRRRGLSYNMLFGVTQLGSGDGTHTSGPSGTLHFGYFPTQTIGLVATGSFAWRHNLVGYRVNEQRYGAELQVMPFFAEIFHVGGYAGVGLAWRLEDGFSRGNDRSPTTAAGVQVQLDVDTHIALTARFGFYTAHDQDYEEPLREASVGISVY